MADLDHFGLLVLLGALGLAATFLLRDLASRLRLPVPAVLLAGAAVLSALAPRMRGLGVVTDQRIVTVALAVILFEGGLRLGRRGVRADAAAIVWLGIAGTVVTAGASAVAVHLMFGQDWRTALLLGAALAPTDPAAVFSVLRGREIGGRTGTLLEGESGANDPVGIAALVSLLAAGGSGAHAVASGLGHFGVQIGVGAVIGVVGGWGVAHLGRSRIFAPAAANPVLLITAGLALYGAAAALGGSGFLATFLAGIVITATRTSGRSSRDEAHLYGVAAELGGVAELVAFVVLGLSIDLGSVRHHAWLGVGVAAVLIVVVRPVFVGAVLAPVHLAGGERVFVLFSGLKGAVPLLLGTVVVGAGAAHAGRIYDVVFVVVLLSLLVQGGLVPVIARACHVPMRAVPPGAAPTAPS